MIKCRTNGKYSTRKDTKKWNDSCEFYIKKAVFQKKHDLFEIL